MHVAVRTHLTAGVVLVGAAAIVASPVRPSIPDIYVPALSASSAAVELTAAANPIAAWVDVFGKTFNNVSQIGGQVVADPAPILRQVIANQLDYAQTLGTGIASIPEAFITWTTVTIPAALQVASEKIAADDIVGAATAISNAVGGVLYVMGGLFGSLPIPGNITDNLTNAVHALTSLGTLMPLVMGALNPIQATVYAAGDSGQAFVNAMNAGDQAAAFNAAINTPAALTDAFLNGIASTRVPRVPGGHSAFNGLFTFKDNPAQGGLVQALLVGLPQAIAAAITPAPEEKAAGAADAASVPAVTAKTVTLNTPISAPAVESPKTTPKPAVQPESETHTAATDVADESTGDTADSESSGMPAVIKPVGIKDGNKAVPGEVATGVNTGNTTTTTAPVRTKTPLKSLRDHVKSTLGKLGLKKRTEHKAGDKADTAKAGADNDSGSTGGSDE